MIGHEHKDARGVFAELVRERDLGKYKQISYLTIEPNFFRGNHYHKITTEAFILLEGDCEIITHEKREDIEVRWHSKPEKAKLHKYDMFEVMPGQQHTLLSKAGAKLLVLSSKEFDALNPDVYVYE